MTRIVSLAAVVSVVALGLGWLVLGGAQRPGPTTPVVHPGWGKVPLAFAPGGRDRFAVEGAGYEVKIGATGSAIRLFGRHGRSALVTTRLEGATRARLSGVARLPGVVN